MAHLSLVLDLVVVVVAALLGGAAAHRLRQPVILGYLVAGVVIGSVTAGAVTDLERVQTLAEIGVALLMFGLGVEFSLKRLGQVRRVALIGGAIQIGVAMLLGVLAAPLLGIDRGAGLYFGAIVALSSTAVISKLLMERGQVDSVHGRISIGILLVQDLSVVPMMVVLPAVLGPATSAHLAADLGLALAKAAGFLAATYLIGTRVLPRLLLAVADTRSRELFMLTIVSLALGTALGTAAFGLSLAFGAFVAGMLISESDFNHQVMAETIPLRDLFATLFFVSVGMLIDPSFLLQNLGLVLVVAATIAVGKSVVVTIIVRAFGYSGQAALLSGLALLQIGEFSFVLAQQGIQAEIIPGYLYDLTLAGALATILITPSALNAGPLLLRWLQRAPLLAGIFREPADAFTPEGAKPLSNHVVICGFGRVGQELADALTRRRFRYLVIDYNPHVATDLRQAGVPSIYGDATNPAVLALAGLGRARALAVALPDELAAEVVVRHARVGNRRLDIIARSASSFGTSRLREAGATEVVRPEFEGALEFIRHTMHRFGVASPEVQAMLSRRRHGYYNEGPETDAEALI